MRFNRALRRWRWTPLAAILAAAACEHGDVNRLVTVDGDTVILRITLSPGGGAPTGTRVVNRFLSTAFDTSLADAFGRSSNNPSMRGADPNGFGYTSGTRPQPVFFASGVRNSVTDKYRPALISDSARATTFYNSPSPVAYIVQAAHPFNGPFWEFWFNLDRLETGKRYTWGMARYAVQQNGALDIAERLLTGNVAAPDSLFFRAGDFTPGGYLGTTNYGEDCATSPAAIAGANPYLLGSDVDAGGIEWDVTICQGAVWSTDFNQTNTPVPTNRAGSLNTNQYNFLVVWEAADAAGNPDYTKPVLRVQIGPLITAAGQVINNAFAPLPSAGQTPAQLALLPGSTSRPDSVTITATNLPMLANASYQVWFTKAGFDSAALATGRFDRLVNNVIVDSNLSTNSFGGDTAAATYRMKIDFGNYSTLAGFTNVVLAIAPAGASTTTLPATQPIWATMAGNKLPGAAAPPLAANMTFGNFDNGGAALARWAPAGTGVGGIAGRRIDVQVLHLLRPPVGFFYNAYLRNQGDTIPLRDLGPITSPFPDYASLLDADLTAGGTVNTVEIVESAVRVEAQSTTELCRYGTIEVRLEPRLKAAQTASTIIALTGDTRYPSLERCQ